MIQANLDWKSIRPLNGGRDKGFEELCAQLASAEVPTGSRFVRKGPPDAGVECYAVLANGSEWGWQAKYFDGLAASQWSQVDKSVKTAIKKHPRLVRYFVCLPLDLPDARVGRQKSARVRWDEHVEKWSKWALKEGMTVEFVYWGNHELLQRLARSEHVGRIRFWFDLRRFDVAWFSARLEEALQTAGPRYTPKIHVDLPIAREFEAFGRTDWFFDHAKAHAREIRKELRAVEYSTVRTADQEVVTSAGDVSSRVHQILGVLGTVQPQPTGALPFLGIVERIRTVEAAIEELLRLLVERKKELAAEPETTTHMVAGSRSHNRFKEYRSQLFDLSFALRRLREDLEHADVIARGALMILRGDAGTGKTHLLCDVAKQRVAQKRPTVLLMGQRFRSNEAPWIQVLQQLDLAGLSAEEFIGALEAAAQAASSRALLMIDALNEGSGRAIWPSNLAAFITSVERSPWIGIVLAVRSSYDGIVIPAEVYTRAAVVTHQGFLEHEYDAMRTFFVHYGLELPSTPLLSPEFCNPLFLKTLCRGLNAKGEQRLPRGFHGITAVFGLYFSAINDGLSTAIGFARHSPLVRRAVEAFVEALLDSGERWLPLSQAMEVVDALLPGREFDQSLYRGLVTEGLLLQDAIPGHLREPEEVVFVAYERLADHLTAKILLDRHLVAHDPTSAFAPGGPLAFICDEGALVSQGLLEALCIQVPERTGQELISLAPACIDRWGLESAFRQSLVWRAYTAFSDDTRRVLNKLCQSDADLQETLEVLLTVSTLPAHPLNAQYLDRQLRKVSMPDRDAWWSAYLHRAWRTHGTVDRLMDWATSLSGATSVDDEAIDLCALSLVWTLTTSNRYLRDRATKALVNMLSGRLGACMRLVERCADIDDLYVVERLYAVAYGVAMRCHDPIAVGTLASCVYSHVFAADNPPPHILLRDYARGVVERALHVGSKVDIDTERIRPPYKSAWPPIPTEEDVAPLLPNWSQESLADSDLEWARNRIGSSVMEDDFARYVIGTNSSATSSAWLSLSLDEPPWRLPARPEDTLLSLVAEFSDEERKAWEKFEAENFDVKLSEALTLGWFMGEVPDSLAISGSGELTFEVEEAHSRDEEALEDRLEKSRAALEAVLTEEHSRRLSDVLRSVEDFGDAGQPPGFELRQIQRYILWRVFNLGWTSERFGVFDRFDIGYNGRAASKAERIGKKYQWIAYHEIMALIADHFQYGGELGDKDGDRAYDGPWQLHLRDIDPSCTVRALRGGSFRDGHVAAWWALTSYDKWGDPKSPRDWALSRDGLPALEDLLIATNPDDGSRWLNCQCHFNWSQQPPVDRESSDVERRDLWYLCSGYLIREDDTRSFLEWAEGVDFWGRWMPDPVEAYRMFLGEHAWAPASRFFQQPYYGDDGWTKPGQGCPVEVRTMAFEYVREGGGFDCSVDEGYTLKLPVTELVAGLDIRWSGRAADFVDAAGGIVSQDPAVFAEGPSALLIREDLLRQFLTREKLRICWSILGEKRVLSPGFGSGPQYPRLRMSGAYVLSESMPLGFVKYMVDDRSAKEGSSMKVVEIVRSGPGVE